VRKPGAVLSQKKEGRDSKRGERQRLLEKRDHRRGILGSNSPGSKKNLVATGELSKTLIKEREVKKGPGEPRTGGGEERGETPRLYNFKNRL